MNFITKVSDGSGTISPADYMTDMSVSQLSRGPVGALALRGEQNATEIQVLRKYTVHDVFPTNVSAIDLSFDLPLLTFFPFSSTITGSKSVNS
jgi:hypothetical protein